MRKIAIVGPLVTVAIAAGVYFGLPVYAEGQFKAALDGWVQARGGGAAYENARLDYWADTATIGSMSDTVTVPVLGADNVLTVTTQDIVIQGYNLDALNRAIESADGSNEIIAERVSWAGFQVLSDDQVLTVEGAAGHITGFGADGYDPVNPVNSRDVAFKTVDQGRITWAANLKDGSIGGDIASIAAKDLSRNAAADLIVKGISAEGSFPSGSEAGDIGVTMKTDLIRYEGVAKGTPVTIARSTQEGFLVSIKPAQPMAQPEPGAPAIEKMEIAIDSIVLENGRADAAVFALYSRVANLLRRGTRPSPEEIAALGEDLLQLLERAVDQQIGAENAVIDGMRIDAGPALQQTIEQFSISGMRGLKIDKAEMLGQTQKQFVALPSASGRTLKIEPTILEISVERSTATGFDFDGLPAYLRQVLGAPITVESLARAEAFYRDNKIADVIPDLDYGVSEAVNYQIKLPDGKNFTIGRAAFDTLKSEAGGKIHFALIFEDMVLDAAALAAANPNAAMGSQMLAAQGIEELSMTFGLDIAADLKGGIITINSLRLADKSLADIQLTGKLAGLNIEQLRQMPPEQRQGAMMSAVLDDFTLSLTDQGGRNFAFAMMGGGRATPEQMAQGLSAQVNAMLSGLGTPKAQELGVIAGNFVLQGGKLAVSTEKAPPVPIIQLMLTAQTKGPGAILDLLQVEASHTAP